MQRERMAGVNSREKIMEAVSELRTKHYIFNTNIISRLRRVSDRYIRFGISCKYAMCIF
jgi:hypothetical protein